MLEIKDFLLRVGLFKNSFGGKTIKDDILKALKEFELKTSNWRVAGSDRASPNCTEVEEVEIDAHVRPLFSPCMPLFCNNTGK